MSLGVAASDVMVPRPLRSGMPDHDPAASCFQVAPLSSDVDNRGGEVDEIGLQAIASWVESTSASSAPAGSPFACGGCPGWHGAVPARVQAPPMGPEESVP